MTIINDEYVGIWSDTHVTPRHVSTCLARLVSNSI